MKTILHIPCLILICAPALDAALVLTESPNINIPDGSSAGLARVLNVTGTAQTITSIVMTLEISAAPGGVAFLGDLFVYLSHGTDAAIILNRPGRTTLAPAGYADNQTLNVSFSDTATNDIHSYRSIATGSATTPLSSSLVGTWLPDGRTTDPASVLDSDLPTARFASFTGDPVVGDWTLFIADLSGGGQHRLVSWSLTIEAVPEPSALLLTLGALPLLARRRR